MYRNLITLLALLSLAGMAFAQGPNAPFDNNPWDGHDAYRTDNGYLAGTTWNGGAADDYHVDAIWDQGYGTDTVWKGFEWGSGYAQADATEKTIYDDMCTMGILVDNDFGVRVDLYHRFYEIHTRGVHSDYTPTVVFSGYIGTNSPILFGLRSQDGTALIRRYGGNDTAEVAVQAIRGYIGDTYTDPISASGPDFLIQHDWCNDTFRFEIDLNIETHLAPGQYHIPFYFCPEQPTV